MSDQAFLEALEKRTRIRQATLRYPAVLSTVT